MNWTWPEPVVGHVYIDTRHMTLIDINCAIELYTVLVVLKYTSVPIYMIWS